MLGEGGGGGMVQSTHSMEVSLTTLRAGTTHAATSQPALSHWKKFSGKSYVPDQSFFVLFLLFFSDPSILTYTLTLRVREDREAESTKIHTVIRNDQESNANANVINASAPLQSPHGPGFPCQSRTPRGKTTDVFA